MSEESNTIDVTNEHYFLGTEWNITKGMRLTEASLRGKVEEAVVDVGLKIGTFPLEGAYRMKMGAFDPVNMEDLQGFFQAVKTLQKNAVAGKKESKALQMLDTFYHNAAFGFGPAGPTLYHPTPGAGWSFLSQERTYLTGMIDGVAAAMLDVANESVGNIAWSVDNPNTRKIVGKIMNLADDGALGTNLVGLAALVDSRDNNYSGQVDPVCLTYALFTTVLSREQIRIGRRGPPPPSYIWKVDSDVEELGTRVVDAYNQAISGVSDVSITPFHEQDATLCIRAARENQRLIGLNRVVRVDSASFAGQEVYLHWAVRAQEGRYRTLAFVSDGIVDPNEYKEDPSIIDKFQPELVVP
jgi:hypothetical protein